jgi:hypothetical protein
MILAPLDPNYVNTADCDTGRRERMGRMAAATVSLDDARTLRDEKMAQALDHAERNDPTWGAQALDYLKWYAETHDRFPGWFVTQAAELCKEVPTPPTLKAWGSIFTKAARQGWIEKCGYRQDPNRHANPCPVWASLIYRKGAA